MLSFLIAAFIAFVASVVAIASVRPIAPHFSLVDKPGGRKLHEAEVPVVGGLGIFLGLFVAVGFLPPEARPPPQFVTICAIFVIVGLADDRFGLSPWFRLLVQIGCVFWLTLDPGLSARYLGDLVGDGPVILQDLPAILLTAILVAGGANAFNMVDGIDGLAGSLGLVAMTSLAHVSVTSGLALPFGVAVATIGSLIAFLLFNFPLKLNRSIRCFMGDAGSLLLGFVIAWLMLTVSQSPDATMDPVLLLFLVSVPIYDLVWVFGSRLLNGLSPFKADNSHLHHILLRAGASHLRALMVLVFLALAFAGTGFLLSTLKIPSSLSLIVFSLCGVSCIVLVKSAKFWLPFARSPHVTEQK